MLIPFILGSYLRSACCQVKWKTGCDGIACCVMTGKSLLDFVLRKDHHGFSTGLQNDCLIVRTLLHLEISVIYLSKTQASGMKSPWTSSYELEWKEKKKKTQAILKPYSMMWCGILMPFLMLLKPHTQLRLDTNYSPAHWPLTTR